MFIVCAAAVALSMNACKSKRQNSANDEVILQEASGLYTGVIPCADCPGISTRVGLNADMTYTLDIRYIDRSDEIFTYSGVFVWDAGSSTITFDNQLIGQCLLEGDALYLLVDGKKKEGANVENYTLTKVDQNLVEKYWKLLELYGNPIAPAANNSREAHITFHVEGNRFSGDAGCNRMMGSFKTREHNQIVLSSAATTMMLCINMETETNFLKALEVTDNYIIKNDTLTLNRETSPVAKFVAVYLR